MYNVMVIDDEELIRQSIISKCKKINIQFDHVIGVGCIQQALFYQKEMKIHIAICDIRLNHENGFELIEKMKQIDNTVEFIILSGYDDFLYAKRALGLGITEYLLKPISTAEIYATLRKCINNIQKQINLNTDVALLQEAHAGFQLYQEFIQGLKTKNLILPCYLSVYSESYSIYSVLIYVEEYITPLFNLLSKEIAASCIWEKGKNCSILKDNNDFIIILFAVQNNEMQKEKKQLFELIENIETQANKNRIYEFIIGMSSCQSDIYKAYKESVYAFRTKLFKSEQHLILFEDSMLNQKKYSLTENQQNIYCILLEDMDYKKICNFYDTILKQLIELESINYIYVQILYNFLRDKILYYYLDAFEDEVLIQNVYVFHSIIHLFNYLKSILLKAVEYYNSKLENNYVGSIVSKLKAKIDQYYFQNLKLEDIAKQNFVSASFLSCQFKNTYGISFQNYLTKVRVEHAKEYLRLGEYHINMVAKICGFSDAQYFCKVFKKETGKTPKEYK